MDHVRSVAVVARGENDCDISVVHHTRGGIDRIVWIIWIVHKRRPPRVIADADVVSILIYKRVVHGLNDRVGRESDIITCAYTDQFRTRCHSLVETGRCNTSACRYACSESSVSSLDIRYRHVLDWYNGKKPGGRLDRQISGCVIDVLDYVLPKLQIGI